MADNNVTGYRNYASILIEKIHELNPGKALFIVGAVYVVILLLNRQKRIAASIVFSLCILWHLFYNPVTQFISSLGVDSFMEAKAGFSLAEAGFWLSTLGNALIPKPHIQALMRLLAFSTLSFYCLGWLLQRHEMGRKYYPIILSSIAAIFIAYSVQKLISDSVCMFIDNSKNFETTMRNYDNKLPSAIKDDSDVNLVIYIGESTTAMNMGLYGYPRNTTPNLGRLSKEDPRLLLFYNLFSTHTHTSLSLLEAFSLPIDRSDDFLPVERRKRVPVVNVLNNVGVRTRLVSNQGMSGTWNQASTIIFRNAEMSFSVDNRRYGNSDALLNRPFDDEFFKKTLYSTVDDNTNSGSHVTFLHSYAGHGPYLDNIRESFRKPVDNYLSMNTSTPITASNTIKNIENYDSAIRYIDYSISKAIDYVRKSNKATIFIYFADHGESPFTGRGHDSSRFIHEMVRIPFLMYFNEAAIKEKPELYHKYEKLSKSRETATLAQLPSVILDLVGIRIIPDAKNPVYLNPLIGEKCAYYSPIVVREVCNGITYVNLNPEKPFNINSHGYRITDMSDAATRDYVESRNDINKFNEIRKKAGTSFEQASRYRLILGMLNPDYANN
ncbi:MAG TPA: sulfatase-like hydrolase/transferase [Chlorobaculum sp.]|nr:sulfatase-like hydrolase/transferase [Chlorobaculum sp.]